MELYENLCKSSLKNYENCSVTRVEVSEKFSTDQLSDSE